VKLADFLRYQVYDSNRKLVPLLTEIQFIKDYLDMEKVRRDDFVYSVHYDISEVKSQQIPPQIILTLIENAVKHSLDPVDHSFIHIRFCIAGDRILMQISNSFSPLHVKWKGPSGLGLFNLKRRLYLLYGKAYRLRFRKKDNLFTATLSLPIAKKSI
jgi:LytS/YehU family sensor histidine kinase